MKLVTVTIPTRRHMQDATAWAECSCSHREPATGFNRNKGDEPIEKQLGSQARENASHKSILGTPVSAERNQPKDNLSEAQLAGSKNTTND